MHTVVSARNLALTLAAAFCCAPAAIAQIASGNVVVLRVGDGSAALTSAATAAFLDEYTPSGTFVQTIALPTTTTGSNRRITNAGSATSEGFLTLSGDGQYLLCAGYDAAVATLAVAGTASATTPRVIARIDLNGVVDTTTALIDAYSAGNIRSVVSDNGTNLWTSGTAASSGSVRFASFGGTTTAQLATTPTNVRVVGIAGGQLYASSASGTFQGVATVGTGLPTTAGQTITLLPGFPTATGPSSYEFFFADPSTLYVADDRASISGGIQKWALVAGTWTLQYTLNPATNVGCRGLSGSVAGSIVTLYATTSTASGNQVVSVVDVGASSTFTTVATAPANTAFRGVRFLPQRGSIGRNVHGCGTVTISAAGQPRIGSTVTITLGGITGQAFLGLGVQIQAIPFCTCTLGHEYLISFPGSSLPLVIPNDPNFIGGRIGVQGADLFSTGGCTSIPFSTSDTLIVNIG